MSVSFSSLRACGLTAFFLVGAAAADAAKADYPTLVGQLLVGTSGVEPGVAAEFAIGADRALIVRPELLVNDHGPGVGCAALWRLPVAVPEGHELGVGPRLVYHNGNTERGEIDVMGIYTFGIVPSKPGHHFIEVIAAFGVLDDQRDGTTFGANVGAAYAYRF